MKRFSCLMMVTLLPAFATLGAAAPPVSASFAAGRVEIDVFEPTAWPASVAARAPGTSAIEVNLVALGAAGSGARLRFAIAPRPLAGVVTRIERRSETQYSVFGTIDGATESFFVLTVEHDALIGRIHAPALQADYRIGFVSGAVHEIESLRGKTFGGCDLSERRARAILPGAAERDKPAPLCPPIPPGAAAAGVCSAPLSHFDVAIYYTGAARLEAGGVNAMNAECQQAVDVANVCYFNSGVPLLMFLVRRLELAYGETGDFGTDRDRLADTSDGHMDIVHGERIAYGADFVSLFVSDAAYGDCGKAYCLPGGPDEGFCVVDRGCASGNYSFAHEIGHLQGCAHDHDNTSACSYYCDSYGHRFYGQTGTWRTVMGYPHDTIPYVRIPWFSNPLVNYDGVPTGLTGCDDGTNNAGTIWGTHPSRTRWAYPRFRVWVGPLNFTDDGTFDYPWPTVAIGVAEIFAGSNPIQQPTLNIKEGVYPEVLTISKPMLIQSCGGSVRIGG